VSDRKLHTASLALAPTGLLDALYLTWAKLSGATLVCVQGLGDCNSVNNSPWSQLMGIPVAAIGALGYVAILAALLLELRSASLAEYAKLALFGFSLVGTIYSAYLTYIEVAVLNQICPYCVVSALLMTAIFVIAIIRLVRTQDTSPA
jgi:uncharacterized membrane protein